MILQDTLKGIQRRERHALEAAEAYVNETDPVKKRKFRLHMENHIEAMHITTRYVCGNNEDVGLENIYREISRSYNPEDYLTVGDCIDQEIIAAKFPNIRLSDENSLP